MAADIKSLRNRIKSVDSTLHLTKAMGLVASSKIRRATEGMNKSKAFSKAISDIINVLTTSSECAKSPYMQKKEVKKTKIIIIAGDRGLAGGYNANVFRLAKEYDGCEFIPIGKRACDRFGEGFVSAEYFMAKDAIELSNKLCDEFVNGDFDKLGIISTKYISMMSQEPVINWILPLEKADNQKSVSMVFEPDEITILNYAVREYVAGVISACVRESFASEVAARRCAMDSAGKNAQEMIDDLQLSYNRARQDAITQELTEIVAGSGV
ncbi:MAG: ATP synthase F1 subunit gamma [Clostridia bacterium]|nr:ATP synthase F1 subunit gamma [Clostridia bacterium]